MTDTDRDAQTIREALESAFGDWEAGLAALERLVAALSAATTERDEALAQVGAATTILAEAEKIVPGIITTAGRFAIGLNDRERALAAEGRAEGLAAQLQDLAHAVIARKCNGCGLPCAEWGPVCAGMTSGDATHYHSPEWWATRARAALAAAAPTTTEGKT